MYLHIDTYQQCTNIFCIIFLKDDNFRNIIAKLLEKIERAEHSIMAHTPTELPEKESVALQKYNKLKVNFSQYLLVPSQHRCNWGAFSPIK